MRKARQDRRADVRLVIGATGTGKSTQARAMLKAHRGRTLIWDYKGDHPRVRAVSLAQLARLALRSKALRYCPQLIPPPAFEPKRRDRAALWMGKQFELFCQIAWQVQQADPDTDCLFLVEELSKVTRPGAAPPWWHQIVELGRAFGFVVVATTQRPAYVDLGIRGAATFIWCGRLGEEDDARAMGRRLGVRHEEIQRLPDLAAFVFDGRETRRTGTSERT